MKTVRAVIELICLWLLITLALGAAAVILHPADPIYLNQPHHRSQS